MTRDPWALPLGLPKRPLKTAAQKLGGVAMTATREFRLEDWQAAVGTVTGQSDVIHIDQAMINAFADVSQDWQPIHVDPKAAAASPFGTTIAHGFLVVSLLAPLGYSA
ncbi:MAG: MaoC/PaaZ C-terminal domain-containing protein, partial [Mangrovicoccus sp.]